ncbi:hypothetical protein CIPAW_07G052500 [Carya illinoinensis]|uniref:Uncharacterized protein n=1 Tax=Carya illinoinensis TaxID=32201 RepID=A0A8T1PZS4_CARIL|nr:hypothetical protein CIPAW_16G047200 [Carya illinoinensis]KAG6647063.1 hypothetical protein CIPAW_07G052500 [Carya illinoinensis]
MHTLEKCRDLTIPNSLKPSLNLNYKIEKIYHHFQSIQTKHPKISLTLQTKQLHQPLKCELFINSYICSTYNLSSKSPITKIFLISRLTNKPTKGRETSRPP